MTHVTTTQAAKILGISGSRVRALVDAGKIRAVKINDRLNMISRSEVTRFSRLTRKAGRPQNPA
jgi:excisionase family DNA binding protein